MEIRLFKFRVLQQLLHMVMVILFNLFVDRLPVLLPVLPVQTETCAFRYLSPVLLTMRKNKSGCFFLRLHLRRGRRQPELGRHELVKSGAENVISQ